MLARIQALQPGATKPDEDKLSKAADALQKALSADLWIDSEPRQVGPGGEKVFDRSKDAAQLLSDLIKDKKGNTPDATLQSMIDDLEGAARLLARTAIDDAIAAGSPANKVAAAESDLAKGDAPRRRGTSGRRSTATSRPGRRAPGCDEVTHPFSAVPALRRGRPTAGPAD